MSDKIHKIIADKLIDQIESGMADGHWTAPWDNMVSELPVNVASGKAYRGINPFLLWAEGHASPYWGTFKQWKDKGAKIRKGERGTLIVFWKFIESKTKTDKNGDPETFPMLRYYKVFNASQVEGWEAPETTGRKLSISEQHSRCDEVVKATGADIQHGGNKACYIPSHDRILMPEFNSFKTADGYYQTAFHELAHWTGHKSRMDRNLRGRFGSHAYALEELLAELSAAILCATMGLETHTRTDHAKYVKGWLAALRETPQCLMAVASKAAKVTDFILEYSEETETQTEAVEA